MRRCWCATRCRSLPFLLLYRRGRMRRRARQLRWPVAAVALAALAVGGLVASGPLPSWLLHPEPVHGTCAVPVRLRRRTRIRIRRSSQLGPVSPFYRELARETARQRDPDRDAGARASRTTCRIPGCRRSTARTSSYALASPVCGVGDWDEYPYTARARVSAASCRSPTCSTAPTSGGRLSRDAPASVDLAAGQRISRGRCRGRTCRRASRRWRARLGEPVYRDEQIAVFALSGRVHFVHQPVADADLGQQVARPRRIGFDLAAQRAHVDAQVLRRFDMRRAPHLAQQLAMRQHLAAVARERGQQLVFDRRQMDVLRRRAARGARRGRSRGRRSRCVAGPFAARGRPDGAAATRRRASSSPMPNGLVR